MNRNILLTRINKKKQEKLKKQFQEQITKNYKQNKQNKQNININKYNPDIKIKYQEDINNRSNIIKPSGFKIDNNIIIDKKDTLSNLLQQKIEERNEKININKQSIKKRIYNNSSNDFLNQKESINKLKQLMDEKIKKGKEANDAILSHYQN